MAKIQQEELGEIQEEQVQPKEDKTRIKVFGPADRTKEGKIKSDYPSWYFQSHKEELEESIRHKKYMIDNDLVPASERNLMQSRLGQEEKRLDEINVSKPELSGNQQDEVKKVVEDVGKNVADAMFRKSEMDKGLADAHEEARRISEPVITITSGDQAEFARACGIKIKNGNKVTRGEAEKMWKIGRRMLGEISNTEVLRKH